MGAWDNGTLVFSANDKESEKIDPKVKERIENNYKLSPFLEDAPGLDFFKAIIHVKEQKVSYVFYPEEVDDIFVVYVYNSKNDLIEKRYFYSVED